MSKPCTEEIILLLKIFSKMDFMSRVETLHKLYLILDTEIEKNVEGDKK